MEHPAGPWKRPGRGCDWALCRLVSVHKQPGALAMRLSPCADAALGTEATEYIPARSVIRARSFEQQ